MDAREREEPQLRRPSIKRPWEEEPISPGTGNAWQGNTLPPIDPAPFRRPSLPIGPELGGNFSNLYQNSRDFGAKRVRYEGTRDYIALSREGKLQSQAPYPIYNPNQGSLESPSEGAWERQGGERADSQDTAILCRRCRRLTTQHQDLELFESCEDCRRNPELALVTSKAAASLSKLADTLTSGLPPQERILIRNREHYGTSSADCPPIEQFGLRHTLDWILGRIQHINGLAEQLVQNVRPETSQILDRNFTGLSTRAEDGLTDIMKRRIDTDGDGGFRDRIENVEPPSDAKLHTRRRSVTTAMMSNEELPSRSQHDYHPSQSVLEGPGQRVSMNPPPAPNRQLPSPPGRSLPSPTSMNFPSPSTGSYGSISQPVNLPHPSGLHQSTLGGYLPPIGTTHSPHSPDALQAHSAALQHEVSVQKIALSSLQGEHDKLLAAFSRSQTRASALEKKHAVSDTEIISLSEEKMRLQAQVIELERDVEELSRSRDEFRQAAVQEGAQYVEIVKKASQLEEMAAEERKSWSKLRAKLEQKIEELGSKSTPASAAGPSSSIPTARVIDEVDTPASSVEAQSDLKLESLGDVRPTSFPMDPLRDSNDSLKEEVRLLRSRCAEAETALRAVRDDSRNMEGIVEALGVARRSILERADRAVGNLED